jgi:hypothetical protein
MGFDQDIKLMDTKMLKMFLKDLKGRLKWEDEERERSEIKETIQEIEIELLNRLFK